MKRILMAAVMALSLMGLAGTGFTSPETQEIVDTSLIGGGFKGGAILKLDGTVDASKNLTVTAEESTKLVAAFKNPSQTLPSVVIASAKYVIVRKGEAFLYGKKASGVGGAVCVATNSYIIIGVHDEMMQPGQASTVLEKVGASLRDKGK